MADAAATARVVTFESVCTTNNARAYDVSLDGAKVGHLYRQHHPALGAARGATHTPGRHGWTFEPDSPEFEEEGYGEACERLGLSDALCSDFKSFRAAKVYLAAQLGKPAIVDNRQEKKA